MPFPVLIIKQQISLTVLVANEALTGTMVVKTSKRPVNLDLNQVLAVNLQNPVAIASILHRLSGVLIFVLVPVLLYLLQISLASEASFDVLVKGWHQNLVLQALVFVTLAGLVYHFVMGCKHLLADLGIGESLEGGRRLALFGMVLAAAGIVCSLLWVMS